LPPYIPKRTDKKYPKYAMQKDITRKSRDKGKFWRLTKIHTATNRHNRAKNLAQKP